MRIFTGIFIAAIMVLIPGCSAWSFRSMFAKLIDDSYSDCLTSHTGFTSNYKSYCDNGKQLIEECDFDEDFDCGNGEGASL